MEKQANSATAALHKRDELQKRLKINAEKRKQAKAAQIENHVIRPLAGGLQFANHVGLQAHFSGRHLESWPTPMRRSSMFKAKARWREKSQSLLPS